MPQLRDVEDLLTSVKSQMPSEYVTFTIVSRATATGMIEPSVVSKSLTAPAVSLYTVALPENTGTLTVLPSPWSSSEKSVAKFLTNAMPRCASMIALLLARMRPGLVRESAIFSYLSLGFGLTLTYLPSAANSAAWAVT